MTHISFKCSFAFQTLGFDTKKPAFLFRYQGVREIDFFDPSIHTSTLPSIHPFFLYDMSTTRP